MRFIKLASLIGESFPQKHGDFIVSQVAQSLKTDRAARAIVLHRKENTSNNKEIIKKFKILENTDFLNIPRGKFKRMYLLPLIFKHPLIFLKSLSFKYYPMNFTLKHYITYCKIKEIGYRIGTLHCHFGQIGIIGSFLKDTGLCDNLIVSFYGGDLTRYVGSSGKKVYNHLFECGDVFIPCTAFLKDILINLGCNPKKIVLIYLPRDANFFVPGKNRKNGKNILTVARLVKQKGIQNGIEAIKILSERYKGLKYIVVGSGDYEKELHQLVEKYSLSEYVDFRGLKTGKGLLKEFQNADIFVLPSISTHKKWVEGGGLVNLEAQLCELPVVATNVGGIPEYVKDGISGFLTNEDPADLANKIEVLIKDPQLRKKMGRNGREFAKQKHSKDNFLRLTEIYKSLNRQQKFYK